MTLATGEERAEFARQVGARIRALAVAQFGTLAELADRLEVMPTAVSQWCRGARMPTGPWLVELAEVLGTTTDHLLGRPPRRRQR